MIFVIKSGIKRDAYDTQKLHDKLYKELNEGGKNQVAMLHQIVRMMLLMIITVRI